MLMFRKVSVFIAGSALTFLLLATVASTTIVTTFTPSNIKSWLSKNNIYSTLINDVLNQNDKLDTNIGDGGESIPLDNPDVKNVIKQTFTPEFLQTNVEKVIDGTYPWLTGKTQKPTFQIDVASVKTQLATNLADYARTRYNGLPKCVGNSVPSANEDILSISCQSPRFNIEAGLQKVQSDIVNSKDFLPNATITADNLTSGEGADKKSVFEGSLKNAPKAYQWARISPFIFGVLSLLAIAVIVFLSTERRKGIRRVGLTLLASGLVVFFIIWLMSEGFQKASTEITKQASKDSTSLNISSTVISLLDTVRTGINQPLQMFAIAFVAIAVGTFAYLIFTRKNAAKASAEEKAAKLLEDEDWPDKEPKEPKKEKSPPK